MRRKVKFSPLMSGLTVIMIIFIFLIVLPILLVGFETSANENGADKAVENESSAYTFSIDTVKYKGIEENIKVKVYITDEKMVKEIDLEDYVKGVVSAEMPITFEDEALKAQSIAARTYVVSKIKKIGGRVCNLHEAEGADICDTVHCQAYKTKEQRMEDWDVRKAEEYWTKLNQIVDSTKGEVITYDGQVINQPLYFSSSGEGTEDAIQVFSSDVPYLKSVDSEGDQIAPNYTTTSKFTAKTLAEKINDKYPKAALSYLNLKRQISILSRNDGGTVNELKIGNETITGRKFRELFGLNSANFTLKFNSDSVEVICKGYGHDVGMSQWGANSMAKDGKSYMEILTHYYTGVQIKEISEVIKSN